MKMSMSFELLLMAIISTVQLCNGVYERPMVVIIPSYKNEQWVEKNLSSVYEQQYDNMRVIYIDDYSPDDTYKKALEITARYNKQACATIIRNEQRCGALANLYNAIISCQDHEIIVTLDGDDWLPDGKTLMRLNEYYNQDIWLTYGQFQEFPGNKGVGHSTPFPEDVIKTNSFRSYHTDRALLPASHLRTFYAWLFKSINIDDLKYEGQFYTMSWDMAFMLPMLEMSGNHHLCINDVMYIYNRVNPISDCYKNARMQLELARQILGKEPYKPLTHPQYFDKDKPQELPITVIIVAHNNEHSVERCLASIEAQRYSNFRIMFIDDGSADDVSICAKRYCEKCAPDMHITLYKNGQMSGYVACAYRSLHACNDDEIVLIMRCNDWLGSSDVFTHINTMFRDQGLWALCGELETFPSRDDLGVPKHCVAAYAWLLKTVKIQEIMYKNFFYPIDFVVAYIDPVLQLAGTHMACTSLCKCMRNTQDMFIGPKDASIGKAFAGIMRSRQPYGQSSGPLIEQADLYNAVRLIIISDDNPVGLQNLLSSLSSQAQGINGIDVIYHAAGASKNAYDETFAQWPMVQHFSYGPETLISLLRGHMRGLQSEFCSVTTDKISIEAPLDFAFCVRQLREHKLDLFLIGLGASLCNLGMFLTESLPYVDLDKKTYAWNCENKKGNWNIPLLEMSVWAKYRLLNMLENLSARSVDEMKMQLQEQCWHADLCCLMFDTIKVLV